MVRVNEFKKAAAERLRALFPQVAEWQESLDATVGDQTVDLLVRFRMGQEQKTLICETRSRGEPRYLREAITRLRELRSHAPGAYPIVAAPYVTPESAALVRRNGCGYLDLSGNCYLAFDSVLIQKEGRPNAGLVRRPLKALFAPRATRVVRALLVERERAWRLDELGRAVGVSLGPRPQRDQAARGARLARAGPATGSTAWTARAISSTPGGTSTATASTGSTRSSPRPATSAASWRPWPGTRPSSG